METKKNPSINTSVTFAQGQVPNILSRLQELLGIPLSLRSTTGETVIKTDYFDGPCSVIRGTETGRLRCRRHYQGIEEKLFRRKVPFVSFCYAGFLVFAVPLNFRGEMIGTLFGSQILPMAMPTKAEAEAHFKGTAAGLKIRDEDSFFDGIAKVRHLDPDFQRVTFLEFLNRLGEDVSSMAFAEKSWARFYRDIRLEFPGIEKFKASAR